MSKLIKSAEVCAICGNISQMTLWRWLGDNSLFFPRPIYVRRYRFWPESAVIEWWNARQSLAA